jgi:hypothetical protein
MKREDTRSVKFRLLEELVPGDMPYPGPATSMTKFAYDGEIDRDVIDLADWMFRDGRLMPSRSISVKLPHRTTPACAGLSQYHTALGLARPGTPHRAFKCAPTFSWEATGNIIEGLDEYVDKTPRWGNEIEGHFYIDKNMTMFVECLKNKPPYGLLCEAGTEIPILDRKDVVLLSGISDRSLSPNIEAIIKRIKCNREQLPELFKAGVVTRGDSSWE